MKRLGHDGAVATDIAVLKAELREEVLPLFRTRAELIRWRAVREYAAAAQEGVAQLREAAGDLGAGPVIPFVQKAIRSTVRVILRADDSSGVIGDLVRELLDLHAELCVATPPPPATLVRWLIRFQFDGVQDFFNPDVAAYADALGPAGLRRFGAELDRIAAELPPEPDEVAERATWQERLADPERYDLLIQQRTVRFTLEHNEQRLAVAERDVPAIIATYGGDQTRAYRVHDVAKALVEIGEVERGIEFARRACAHEDGWQAEQAGHYWCELLAQHHPSQALAARQQVFDRWPSQSNATQLYRAAGDQWPEYSEHVLAELQHRPEDYVSFLLEPLGDASLAWAEAHRLKLGRPDLWTRLVDAYQQVDPAAVLPILRELIEADLTVADVRNYRSAARRLTQLRRISTKAGQREQAGAYVAALRQQHRNRPRFLTELTRAGHR